jgi:hypothetical protein
LNKYKDIYELEEIRREEEVYYLKHEYMLKLLLIPESKIYGIFKLIPLIKKQAKKKQNSIEF